MGGGRSARLAIKEGDLLLYTDTLGQMPGREDSVLGLYHQDTRYLSRPWLTVGRPPAGAALVHGGARLRPPRRAHQPRGADAGRAHAAAGDRARAPHALRGRPALRAAARAQLPPGRRRARARPALRRRLRRPLRGARPAAAQARHAPRRRSRDGLADARLPRARRGAAPDRRDVHRTRPSRSSRAGRAGACGWRPASASTIRYDVQVVGAGRAGAARGRLQRQARRRCATSTSAGTPAPPTSSPTTSRSTRSCAAGRTTCACCRPRSTASASPMAGLPWFVAPFGRELMLVGLETLLLDLRWAQAAVRFLERRQGKHDSAFREEQPGKIMHELRRGELAGMRAIPHTPYYGSVDATPLWLLLVAELTMWTGDLDGFDCCHDAVDAALALARRATATSTATASSSTSAARAPGCATRAGATPATPSLHRDGSAGRRAHRAGRDAGLRVLRQAPPRRDLRPARRRRARRAAHAAGRRAQEALQRALLDGGRGLLRHGARRREAAGEDGLLDLGHAFWSRIVADEYVPAVVKRLWRRTCSPAGGSAR